MTRTDEHAEVGITIGRAGLIWAAIPEAFREDDGDLVKSVSNLALDVETSRRIIDDLRAELDQERAAHTGTMRGRAELLGLVMFVEQVFASGILTPLMSSPRVRELLVSIARRRA